MKFGKEMFYQAKKEKEGCMLTSQWRYSFCYALLININADNNYYENKSRNPSLDFGDIEIKLTSASDQNRVRIIPG